MKLDKQTIMLFGGGLVVGYLICKLMSKSSVKTAEPVPAPQGEAQV
jgi:hypothetical protein